VTAAWMGRRWEQFVEFHLYHFSPLALRLALERAGLAAVHIEDADQFGSAGDTYPPPALGFRAVLGRLRDRAWLLAGHDAFNVMIATARRPARVTACSRTRAGHGSPPSSSRGTRSSTSAAVSSTSPGAT